MNSPSSHPSAREEATQSIPAARLKEIFSIFGGYYQLSLNGTLHPCRSVLELIRHEWVPDDPQTILARRPNLLAVMMNPGSSQPLKPNFVAPIRRTPAPTNDPVRLVPAKPDVTQYQIMRLLVRLGWGHARILNLSDLRESKSPAFLEKIGRLATEPNGEAHSLFDPGRRTELARLAGPPGEAPVLLGWGRHRGLQPLAERCLAAFAGWAQVGAAAEPAPWAFFHPSPPVQRMKDAWMARILDVLEPQKGSPTDRGRVTCPLLPRERDPEASGKK